MSARNLSKSLWRTEILSDSGQKIPNSFGQNRSSVTVMEQLQNSSYNKSIVRQVHIAALHKEQQQIAEAVEKAERGDDG